jgi:hypothetical protein
MKKRTVQDRYGNAANGEKIRLLYDASEDVLDIFFRENEPATGVELTDHIKLSHFQASPTKRIPLTYVEPYHLATAA